MEVKFGGKLEIGDLIMVSNGNSLHMGIFAGTGKGSLQYYYPHYIIGNHTYYTMKGVEPKYHKTYIYGTYLNTRVVKITPDQITNEEEYKAYQEAITILKQANKIK